ncbi:hypothetical protein FRB99_002461, partial [Tulasnella sp. 403]
MVVHKVKSQPKRFRPSPIKQSRHETALIMMAPSATRPKNPSPLHRNLRKPTTSKPSWNQLFEERQDEDEDANDYDSSDDESAEDWDEGRTLIDSLKIIEKSDDSLENALARVETLEGPMAAQSKKLQQDLIDVLVPAMDHIRLIHGLIEDSVEAKYTSAILEFDQAADMYQSNASDARTEMLEMLETSKKTLREQLHIIRTEYAKREKLQDDLQTAVKAI